MKMLEGRSTSIEIPSNYVEKIEKYIQSDSYDKSISSLVEQLIHITILSGYAPYRHIEGGEKVYINQKQYREFIAKAKGKGYKNGLECLKELIDEKENYALQYGNDKQPKDNPWAIKIGEEYINLAKEVGLSIAGDSQNHRSKVTNYIVNQLTKKKKGNETDIYQINGESTSHEIQNNPFENEQSVKTSEFLNWLERIVKRRLEFLEEKGCKGYLWEEDANGGKGLNLHLPHSFSRIFIVIDSEEISEEIFKQINDICRMENEINAVKLFSVNIHMIVTMPRDKMHEIIDNKTVRSFLDYMTSLIETDGEGIEKGEEVAITTRKGHNRKVINTNGLLY